jgi:hypothetical protein
MAEVTKAVVGGDLTKKIEVDLRGEILELKETVNWIMDSLSVFPDEVRCVAREVGTEHHLEGQAQVTNVGGTWKDLTDNVNIMANNVSLFLLEYLETFADTWFAIYCTLQVRTIAVATVHLTLLMSGGVVLMGSCAIDCP